MRARCGRVLGITWLACEVKSWWKPTKSLSPWRKLGQPVELSQTVRWSIALPMWTHCSVVCCTSFGPFPGEINTSVVRFVLAFRKIYTFVVWISLAFTREINTSVVWILVAFPREISTSVVWILLAFAREINTLVVWIFLVKLTLLLYEFH